MNTENAMTSAADVIWNRHGSAHDHARVSVWMPKTTPFARPQVHSHGCNDPDTLPTGPVMAYLTLGGVEFGGYFTELVEQLDAAQEALAWVRERAESMGAVVATDGYYAGYLVGPDPS